MTTSQPIALVSTFVKNYKSTIENYFSGDTQQAMNFFSHIRADIEKNPKLLKCTQSSLFDAYLTMAQLRLMPSNVGGEAYVIPYGDKAQFQIGYKGIVTLLYRSGVLSILSDIVMEKDSFAITNGKIEHTKDILQDRGEAVACYVIIKLHTGEEIHHAMNKKDIIYIGEKFSKSYKKSDSAWQAGKDPQLWMWRKTVLIQASKLVPKNEQFARAIEKDYASDSTIERESTRVEEAMTEATHTLSLRAMEETILPLTTANDEQPTQGN